MQSPELSPLPPDFLARWERWYPDAPPVGFLLREAYADRWLRIHAMPASKRMPTSGWDYAELVGRYNAVADEVLGSGSICALVVLHECDADWASQLSGAVESTRLQDLGMLPEDLWDEEAGAFAVPMCIRGAMTVWNRGGFDGFFSAAAQDRLRGLLVEAHRGQVVAPYDGGADLIFATSWERDQARDRYSDWISPRADGL